MPRKVTLKQVGYLVEGIAIINMWGGGRGFVDMDKRKLPLGKMCKSNLLSCINDGRFGCESFEGADIMVSDLYENGYSEFNRTFYVKARPARQKLFCAGI